MIIFRFAACAASGLASAMLMASPVAAATRTVPITVSLTARPAQPLAWSIADESFNDHRQERYRRHHDGFDGGDLLGVLLIGGVIAASVAAIGNAKDKRLGDRTDGRDYPAAAERIYQYRSDGTRMPEQDYRRPGDGSDRPYDYREPRHQPDRQSGQIDGRETDSAVAACSAEAARSGEVDKIFDVEKIDGEWRIEGDYRDGRAFTCSVDGNGRAYVGEGDHADDRYGAGRSPDFTDPSGR